MAASSSVASSQARFFKAPNLIWVKLQRAPVIAQSSSGFSLRDPGDPPVVICFGVLGFALYGLAKSLNRFF